MLRWNQPKLLSHLSRPTRLNRLSLPSSPILPNRRRCRQSWVHKPYLPFRLFRPFRQPPERPLFLVYPRFQPCPRSRVAI